MGLERSSAPWGCDTLPQIVSLLKISDEPGDDREGKVPMEHDGNIWEPHQLVEQAPAVVTDAPAANEALHGADPFQATVELATVGIAHLDEVGRSLYVNPALLQLTGYAHEELLSIPFEGIIHPDDVAAYKSHFRHLLAGETYETTVCRLERRYEQPEEPVVWALVTLIAPPARPGAPRYIIARVEDVSERKRLDDQLRAANQQLTRAAHESQEQANDLAAILDAMTDLVVVFDADGHARRVNQTARDFMGSHPTLEAGRRHLGLTDAQGRSIPPEQWVSARVLRGEMVTGAQAVDMQADAGAGRKILVNVNGAPVRDAQGRIVGGVIVMRDVTERRRLERRAQEALQALLQMAQTLVAITPESTPAPQAGASGYGAPLALNPVAQRLAELAVRVLGCQRVGIVALEADGALMRPIALTGLPPEQAQVWLATLNGRSLTTFVGAERMRKLRAGETVELDLNQQPLRSVARGGPVALAAPLLAGDQLVGALALGYEQEPHAYTDDELELARALGRLVALVIERERLLQEREEARANVLALREANRRMDEFLGIAAHELRTPLTTLLGTVHLLERRFARAPLTGRTHEDLADQLRMVGRLLRPMDQQGRRLSRFVSDLVDTSRIQTGQMAIHPLRCDLVAIVRGAVEEQRLANPERVIELALPGEAEALALADADRLGQVVANYLTNALKYSREDKPIEARLSIDGETARVAVRDDGPGLPPEEQARIWELFHRAPGIEVRSGSGIGLGMGLHICKTIIELHGGHVGVESAVGQGATFWFKLPLAAEAVASGADGM
jgi:PAS domain S-box-containing protein